MESQIKNLQLQEASRPLTEEELLKLRNLVANYNEIQTKLDTWWWQRAKANWLKHRSPLSSMRQLPREHENRIFSLQIGEIKWCLEDHLNSHFTSKWCLEDRTYAEGLPSLRMRISAADSQLLLSMPSEKKLRMLFFSFGKNKAPGFDGVTHSFFTHFWSFTMAKTIEAV